MDKRHSDFKGLGRVRPQRRLVVDILMATAIVGALAAFALEIYTTSKAHGCSVGDPPSTERRDWRPDIRHCQADNTDLWNCIRGEVKRDDI